MYERDGYGPWLTVNDLGVIVDTGTLDLDFFVFSVLVPEFGVIADTVGRTSVSHYYGYLGGERRKVKSQYTN